MGKVVLGSDCQCHCRVRTDRDGEGAVGFVNTGGEPGRVGGTGEACSPGVQQGIMTRLEC